VANKNKAKGSSWETKITNVLNSRDLRARRKVLSGSLDKGDIELLDIPLIIEAKDCKTVKLAEWVDEAEIEAQNANVIWSVVWHHRPRKQDPADGYVTMRGETFIRMLKEFKSNMVS
jgi:hypothetical protein